MKNKKKKAFLEGKNKYVFFGTIGFATLGIVSLVVGFGLSKGWLSVLNWFTSRWAIYIYIIVALLGFLVAYLIFKKKMGE